MFLHCYNNVLVIFLCVEIQLSLFVQNISNYFQLTISLQQGHILQFYCDRPWHPDSKKKDSCSSWSSVSSPPVETWSIILWQFLLPQFNIFVLWNSKRNNLENVNMCHFYVLGTFQTKNLSTWIIYTWAIWKDFANKSNSNIKIENQIMNNP